MGQNGELCLSARGRLPGTLCVHTWCCGMSVLNLYFVQFLLQITRGNKSRLDLDKQTQQLYQTVKYVQLLTRRFTVFLAQCAPISTHAQSVREATRNGPALIAPSIITISQHTISLMTTHFCVTVRQLPRPSFHLTA